jgi:MFS family permease
MGGALVMPTTLAIALQVVPEEQHGRVTSYVVAGAQAIFVLGPLLGGLLVEHVSWRAVFYLALPAGLVSLLIVRAVPWSEAKATRESAGLRSYTGLSLLLASGLSFFVFGLQQASGAAGFDPLSLVTMSIGMVLLVVFAVRNLGASRPLLPLTLFGLFSYTHFSVSVALAQMFAVAICVFVPQTLQTEFGLTPSAAGVILLAFIGGWMAMVPVAGRLYDKVGPANLLLVGPAIALAGFVAFDLASRGSDVSAIVPWLFLCGLGIGLTVLPSYVGAISAGAQTERASVIGLTQTFRQVAGSLAIAVLAGAFVLPHSVKEHGYAAVKDGYFLIMLLLAATVAFNGTCWLVQRFVRREADVPGPDEKS